MVTRIWRGWAAEDSAAEIAASLRAGVLARFEAMPGNVSAEVLRRPLNGGVRLGQSVEACVGQEVHPP